MQADKNHNRKKQRGLHTIVSPFVFVRNLLNITERTDRYVTWLVAVEYL